MNNRLIHVFIAFIPLLLTPALVFLLAEGWLDLGGGEKDILLALPYFIWSLIFFIVALVLIIKRWALRKTLRRSFIISLCFMVVLASVTYAFSWLGVA